METNIPVISLSLYDSKNSDDKNRFIKSVGEGLKYLGFISIVDHHISEAQIARAYQCAQRFYSLAPEQKLPYEQAELCGQRGYTSFQKERAKGSQIGDLKEFWHVGPIQNDCKIPNIWPSEITDFKEAFESVYLSLLDCAHVLLEACALYIGEPKNLFTDMIQGADSILRIIHYPPVLGQTCGAVRAAAHEDINLITLLCGATQPGLEILRHDQKWVSIPAVPGQIIVDTGDMLQNLTNGIFKSTTHRVVNPTDENISRYSMPFFVHPRSDVSLSPLDSCVKQTGKRSEFRNFSAGEYLSERLGEIGLMTKTSDLSPMDSIIT